MVEETLLETWHHLDGFHSYAGDRLAWLENAEDRMAFWLRFS